MKNIKHIILAVVLIVLLVLLGGVAYADDLSIFEAKCFKDGHAEILVQSNNADEKIYTKNIKLNAEFLTWYGAVQKKIELTGGWVDKQEYVRAGVDRQKESALFKTNETLLREAGTYRIYAEYNIEEHENTKTANLSFECAGMIFSCTLVNINIEKCRTTSNGRFEAVLDIRGLNQSETAKMDLYNDVGYIIKASEKYEDIRGEFSEIGSLPKGFVMTERDGKYYLSNEFKDNSVISFVAKFNGLNECDNKFKYPGVSLYSYKECEIAESSEKSAVAENSTNKTEQAGLEAEKAKNTEQKIPENKIIISGVKKDKSKDYIIYSLIFAIACLCVVIFVMRKKQKANKWV